MYSHLSGRNQRFFFKKSKTIYHNYDHILLNFQIPLGCNLNVREGLVQTTTYLRCVRILLPGSNRSIHSSGS